MQTVKLEKVSFRYSKEIDEYALKNVSLEIERGEFVCLLGHNGSGKSTLARLLNGLLLAESGTVEIDGQNVAEKGNLFEIRKKVGMVFQNPDNQMVASIVEDDLAFGAENIGIEREEIATRIDAALAAVDMTEFKKSTPSRLSGGQKQRIAIASALTVKPEILVLDEATAMLDPKGRAEVMKIVRKLNSENGITVICITHFMEEAVNADKIFVLKNGEISITGKPEEVFSKEKELKDCGLDLPRPTQIFNELKRRGIPLVGEVFTKEQLSEKLKEIFLR